jgi:hypothetical protein
MEDLIEIETNEKHERLAEMKAEFNSLIKRAKTEAEKELLTD